MRLFGDPAAALVTAQTALEQAEARANKLTDERAAVFVEAGEEYLAQAAKLGHAISGALADAGVHRERIAVLHQRCRELEQHRREQQKVAALADIRKRLVKRHEAARKLDAALAQLSSAFAECVRADEMAFSNWPAVVSPLGRLNHFRLDAFEALSAHRIPRPPSAGPVRVLAEHEPFNFAAAIEARNAEVVEMLEGAPVVELAEEVAA
jgi:HPt (histidine-containing phosphotransfer) domain-containing protein